MLSGVTIGTVTQNSAGTLVLTFNSNATEARVNEAMQSIAYANSSDTPPCFSVQIDWTFSDGNSGNAQGTGSALTAAASTTVNITAVNDAPTVAASGGTTAASEQVAIAVDTGLTLSDLDSANLTSATVSITTGFLNSQDVLTFVAQNGISGSYDSGTGVLTLSGSASVANYQTALRSVTYTDTSNTPNTANRIISFVVSDGTDASTVATKTVSVTAVNDVPVVTASGGTTAASEQVAIAVDSGLTLSDADNTNLASASVSITTGFQAGQDVLTFVDQNGISGSYDSGTGILTLSGSASVANYQTALRSVTYTDTSNTPNTANRTVSFAVNDGTDPSVASTKTMSVTAVNDAPGVTASGGTTAATRQVAIAVDAGLALSDLDSANLTSATVSITTGFQTGEDVLTFVNQAGISGSYDSGAGVLTLSGSASVANYQTALRSVTYTDISNTPNTSNRVVSFVVNDGTDPSTAATKTVSVAANDVPVVTASGGTTAASEQVAIAVDGALTVTDIDSPNLISATVSITTGFQTGQDVLTFVNQNGISGSYNSETGVLTLSGSSSVANYQAALRSVTYTDISNTPNTSNRVVSFVVNDGIDPEHHLDQDGERGGGQRCAGGGGVGRHHGGERAGGDCGRCRAGAVGPRQRQPGLGDGVDHDRISNRAGRADVREPERDQRQLQFRNRRDDAERVVERRQLPSGAAFGGLHEYLERPEYREPYRELRGQRRHRSKHRFDQDGERGGGQRHTGHYFQRRRQQRDDLACRKYRPGDNYSGQRS